MGEKKVRNMFASSISLSFDAEPKLIIDPNPPSLCDPTFGTWIPCSEYLPEMHEATNIFAKAGIKEVSDICIATVYDGQKYHVDTSCRLRDGEWRSELISTLIAINKKPEVIAWMPLPKPYKAESEESI